MYLSHYLSVNAVLVKHLSCAVCSVYLKSKVSEHLSCLWYLTLVRISDSDEYSALLAKLVASSSKTLIQ